MVSTQTQMPISPSDNRFHSKWGYVSTLGFTQMPDALFKSQSQLGLDCTEFVVLLNVLTHWWFKDRNPFPTTFTLAKRTGVSTRTAQRAIKALEAKGLIIKKRGRRGREFDVGPLVGKLNAIAAGFPILASQQKEI